MHIIEIQLLHSKVKNNMQVLQEHKLFHLKNSNSKKCRIKEKVEFILYKGINKNMLTILKIQLPI
jgi:hypothetical protein